LTKPGLESKAAPIPPLNENGLGPEMWQKLLE
jgi:hypothetical protein